MNRKRLVAMVFVVGVVASACGAAPPPPDKAGTETLTLSAAAIDDINVNGMSVGPQAFLDAIERVSGGHIKVETSEGYGGKVPDRELQYAKALETGQLDLGWPNARSLADAGISGFQALEAPMTITSYDALKAVVTSPVAGQLLDRTADTGLKGLGIVMGPLRRPFAGASPLLAPDDWQGVSLRATSPVQREAYDLLGAKPVNYEGGFGEAVQDGALGGGEFDIAQAAHNGMNGDQVRFVTSNVVLWPKLLVLAVSKQRWDSLSDQQRTWLQEAAKTAIDASVAKDYDESVQASELCDAGLRFVPATNAQLAAMRDALAPVVDRIAKDPVSGPFLADIRDIVVKHPGIEQPYVPEACRAEVVAPQPSPTIPAANAPIPNGTYRREADDGTWTYVFEDGIFTLTCSFKDHPASDCGNPGADDSMVEAGYLHGDEGQVWMIIDGDVMHERSGCKLPPANAVGYCTVWPPYGFTWSLDGNTLTLTDLPSGKTSTDWTRIE